MSRKKPNPDDRKDNVKKIQTIIHNTMDNMREAEFAKEFSNPEEQLRIDEKNRRRREAIEDLREEIKDEVKAMKKDKKDD